MKFATSLLIAVFVVGALAQQQAAPANETAASYPRGGRGRNWGRYMCNLIAVQDSDVTVRSCLSTVRDIRSDCEDRYEDDDLDEDECSSSNDARVRRQIKSCVKERVEDEFDFETLDELSSSQRDEFLSEACEDASNSRSCQQDFRRLIDACKNVARLSDDDDSAFDRCTKPIKMAFRGSRSSRRRRRRSSRDRRERSNRRRRRRRRRRDSPESSDAAPRNDAPPANAAATGKLLEENADAVFGEDFESSEAFADELFGSVEEN